MNRERIPLINVIVLVLLFLALPQNAACSDQSTSAPSTEELTLRVKKLEKLISTDEKKNTKRLQNLKEKLSRDQDRLKINGFLTAGVVKGEGNLINGTEANGLDFSEGLGYRTDSVAAVQFNYMLTQQAQAIMQLVATGPKEFEVEAEWLYLKYQLTDQLAFRAGRMRLPFYINSENIAVGFTFPWVRTPVDLYTQELTVYEGFDVLYQFSTGEWTHNLQAIYGGTSSTQFKVTKLTGAVVASSYGPWTFRLSYQRGTLTVIEFPDFGIPKAEYGTFSLQYDDGDWIFIGEINELLIRTGPTAPFAAGYISLGKHFNKWTPYVLLGKRMSTEKNDWEFLRVAVQAQNINSPVSRSQSAMLGVRYDLTSSVAIKGEYQRFYGFEEDEFGIVTITPFTNSDAPSADAIIDLYSVAVSVVF